MRRMIFAFALTLILSIVVTAQRPVQLANGDQRPIIHRTGTFEGIEAAPGVVHESGKIRTGTTYAADISGTLAGHFTAVFDSAGPNPDPNGGNQIVRGSWTFVVYQKGVYQGTLYGEITTGYMEWKGTDTGMLFGSVRAELTIKGGTKGMSDVGSDRAFGTFTILWESNPKGVEAVTLPALTGILELAF